MISLILRRSVLSLLTLLVVSAIVFTLTELLPGDVATAMLGREATPGRLAALRAELGLDRPPLERYAGWLGGVARGDFGDSHAQRHPVADLIAPRARDTLLLAGVAAPIGIPLAFALGVTAALFRNRWPDTVASSTALVAMSLPEFVIGSVLILVFALHLRLAPAVTTVSANAPLADLLPSLWLPAAALTIVMAAYILRMLRSSLIDVLESDYVRMATLKGVGRGDVVLRHALPSALLPTISAVATTVAWLLGGVVVIETVFNYPGVGRLLVSGVYDRDLPLVQAIALLGAGSYVAINLLADLAMLALNPRLRSAYGGAA
jgi:peptide/nickel transport system permease protein